MKHLYKNIACLGMMLIALIGFNSCRNDDSRIGYDISGHWFGDMYYNGERAQGTEIEFYNKGWSYSSGTGMQVDYYRYHAVTSYFNWHVSNRILYLTFDNPDLDCAIVDYTLGYDYFRGYIADYYTLENLTYFNLRNYDRYWDSYGYGYYEYYARATRSAADSTSVAAPADSTSAGSGSIRGIYLNKH